MVSAVVRVAVGVVENARGEVLIARRPEGAHQGGLWEFPGGKVDEGETLARALARELDEELSIRVTASEPLIEIRHDYPDKSVCLQVCRVSGFDGEPRGNEGQPVRWVAPESLSDYDFPAANRPILNAIRLPRQLLITGPAESDRDWWQRLERALDAGAHWIMLRAPELAPAAYRERAWQALAACRRRGVRLLAHGDRERMLPEFDGLHMPGRVLWQCEQRPVSTDQWWGASCHSPEELARAVRLEVDYVTLSPVNPTASHPGASPLGWERFAQWVAAAPLPVFALGGVGPDDLPEALAAGAQGIAGIRFGWRGSEEGQ